jgi:signal transduction histidine kinase
MKIDQPFRRIARSPTFVTRVGRNSGLDGNQRHRGPDRLAKDQVRPRVVDCLAGLLASITAIAAADRPGCRAQRPRSGVVGTRLAGVIAVLGAAVYDYLFTPPLYSFDISDPQNVIALGIFLITALVVGKLAARVRQAARESARLYEAQSALLRVATRAAQSNPPAPVVDVVCRELGLLCGADLAVVNRYEQDGTTTLVAAWSKVAGELAVGARFELVGPSIAREVRSGAPARICSYADSTGPIANEARKLGIRSAIGCPIMVSGRRWGVFVASTKSKTPFPPGAESEIARFTDIVAAVIVTSAESRVELSASRARVVAAADEVRRRLGRDLHDGVQQRLVSVGLKLRLACDAVPAELSTVHADLCQLTEEFNEAHEELRELARGLHPSIVSKAGLAPALRTLARRSAVPVTLDVDTEARYPAPVELTAFYVVSEALTNTIKHANASLVEVVVEDRDTALVVSIRDDGGGGADPRNGSGLIGLRDRVEAIGGSMQITSPVAGGTTIHISLPIDQIDGAASDWSPQSPI